MRSRFTLPKIISAASAARRASSPSWMRPSAFRCALEALHAERQPVHACGAVAGESLALERAGIRLQRDLGIGRAAARARAPRRAAGRSTPRENRLGVPPPMNTRDDLAAPDLRAARARDRRSAHRRRRPPGSSPRASCELKSQYGHLRTHHGMWTYSDSGGSASKRGRAGRRERSRRVVMSTCLRATASEAAFDQRAHRLAAMRERVLALERQLGAGQARSRSSKYGS